MPTTQQILTEINTDPKSLGYAALKVQSNGPEAVAAKMNQVGASAETIFKGYTPTEDLLPAILLTEYATLTQANRDYLSVLFAPRQVKTGDATLRTQIGAVFGAGTTSRTNLTNAASRSATRAEALWGEGTVISDQQVALAINP